MRARDLLLGIGIVASVCGAAAPRGRMVRVPGGTWRPMYGTAVKIASFAIDRDPVTRDEYLRWKGLAGSIANPRTPMTEVTWSEARAYCLARGARLPTLAEWEYVAAVDTASVSRVLAAYATRRPASRVDGAATNRHGVRGLHDLVWEWVGDPNARIVAEHAHRAQDLSCAGAAIGASDPRDYPAFLRAAFRSGLTATTRLSTLGFRCAA
jgi:formylglycine-generating enzyme